jgi:hypothetical protein
MKRKHIVEYRPTARQRLRNKRRLHPLLCNRLINKRPFIGNGSVNTPTRIEEMLSADFFSAECASKLYYIRKVSTLIPGQDFLFFRVLSCVRQLGVIKVSFLLIRLVRGGVQLGPLGTAATDWPIVACTG